MPPIVRKKRLNVPQKGTEPTNYRSNLSEAKQVDPDVKTHSDFSIGSHNHLL
jgi:hypothetical protein